MFAVAPTEKLLNRPLDVEPSLPLFSRSEATPTEALLDTICRMDGKIRLVVGRTGEVLAANEAVRQFLPESDCIALADGKLRAVHASDDLTLRKLLEVRGLEVRTAVLDRQSLGGHCILRAAAISDLEVCISIIPSTDDCHPHLPNLGNAFGLTPAENIIVSAMFSGSTPQQIAEDQAVSVNTVRAHLRSCYSKLSVNCREELFQKLQAYCIAKDFLP